MSSSLSATYAFIGKQLVIYGGIPMIIAGVLGGIFNILVFLSLRTFRESSCAFYLTIMSVVNIGQLLIGVLSRILIAIYNEDGSEYSIFYCKSRLYFVAVCGTISVTCFCLATIDQYCATCSRPRLQQLCNIKFAKRLVIIISIIWLLHAIPYIIFHNHTISPTTGKIVCSLTNAILAQYRTYVVLLTLYGFLPVTILIVFGSMAYINVRRIAYYGVPLVRRELDKQLTVMVLVQAIMNCCTVLPYTIVTAVQTATNVSNNSIAQAQIQLASTITLIISFLNYSSPFYIYICVSERFRRQLIYVLFKIHFNRCRQQLNQVMPE